MRSMGEGSVRWLSGRDEVRHRIQSRPPEGVCSSATRRRIRRRQSRPRRDGISKFVGRRKKICAQTRKCAFPYGGPFNFTPFARDQTRDAGYSCCVSCYGGFVTAQTDVFAVPREPVSTWYRSCYHFGFEMLMRALRGESGLDEEQTREWGL